jgi:hypothetical protein
MNKDTKRKWSLRVEGTLAILSLTFMVYFTIRYCNFGYNSDLLWFVVTFIASGIFGGGFMADLTGELPPGDGYRGGECKCRCNCKC